MPRRANAPAPCRPPATLPRRLVVYQQLRGAIETGIFAPGSRLPPSREQAIALGVSRNTLLWVLKRLRAEGYVRARVGDGSHVSETLARAGAAQADRAGLAARALPAPTSGPQALSRRGWRFGYAAYAEAETADALDRIAPLRRRALG